jgi:hypothetical protein
MNRRSTCLEVTYFPTYLPIYETYFLQNWVTKVKPNINSVEVHPQLSTNGHPVDGALVRWWALVQTVARLWFADFADFCLSCCVRAEIVCSTTDRCVRAQVLV